MLKYLKRYWYWCLAAPLFMVGEITMDLVQPDMMRTIVDNGVMVKNMTVILTMGIRMILLVLLGGTCGITCGVFANIAAQKFANDLRKDVFGRIMNLSFEQTDMFSTGSLVTRLTNDVTQVQNMVMMSLRGLIRNMTMFLGGIYMLYRQSPEFAATAAVALPFVIFFIVFFMKKASPMFKIVQSKLDGVNNVMQEDVMAARVVKAYVMEDYELSRFDSANDALCEVNLRVQSLLAFMPPCMNIVLNACVVAIIYVGGLSVQSGTGVTTGEIMAAITYISMILHSVTFMANIFQTFTRAGASAARIREVLDAKPSIKDGSVKETGGKKEGTVEFRNVSFSYPTSSGEKVLDGINLTVKSGETLAVLGSTGSGKSTLAQLIPRFYDATSGEILVDGVNVRDYELPKLREKIAIVLQNAELYSRSIEENIRWGRDNAVPSEIKKAAQIAQADDFICRSEYGYYTQVTERGHSLSGGQKQRISVSRAVLRHPEIMIFDDSTSALDLSTESKLFKALGNEHPDATKIIIAQRIASVRTADRIAILDDGKLSACAPHEELLKISGIYRDIYNLQMKAEEK